jgi:hypothetical protein
MTCLLSTMEERSTMLKRSGAEFRDVGSAPFPVRSSAAVIDKDFSRTQKKFDARLTFAIQASPCRKRNNFLRIRNR